MILTGCNHNGCIVQMKHANIKILRSYGRLLQYYSIYKEYHAGVEFHDSTDERFLIEWENEPYWRNRLLREMGIKGYPHTIEKNGIIDYRGDFYSTNVQIYTWQEGNSIAIDVFVGGVEW